MAEPSGLISSTGRQLRAHQWWNHKVPVVLATEYTVLAAGSGASTARLLADTTLFLVAIIGVAGFGHVVNDLFDRGPDAAAGKPNTITGLAPSRIAQLLGALVAVSLLPWVWLPHRATALVLLAAEMLLLLAYAAPPIRLKDRGAAGAVADAAYGFVLPVTLAAATFAPLARPGLGRIALILAVVWAVTSGIRGIVVHQLEDLDADRSAGSSTWVGRLGRTRAGRVIATVLPIEAAALVALMIVLRPVLPLAPYVLLGFVAFRWFQVVHLWPEAPAAGWHRTAEGLSRVIGFGFINEFTSYWFPVLAVATLTVHRPTLAPLLVAQMGLFHTPWRDVRALLSLLLHWGALVAQAARRGIRRASHSPIRHAPAPVLGVAYLALALSTSRLSAGRAIGQLLAVGATLQGLAWVGRAVAARPRPDPVDAPSADDREAPRHSGWPQWAPIVAALALTVGGCVALWSWAASTTALGIAVAAAAIMALVASRPRSGLGWPALEVVGRIGLPALISWRAVFDDPGVRDHPIWATAAIVWLMATALRGAWSRVLSEAWVRDWLPPSDIDAEVIEQRRSVVTRLLLPLDLVLLSVVLFALLRAAPAMALIFAIFLPWCLVSTRHRRGGHWKTEGDTRTKTIHRPLVAVLGEFAEQWLAPLALGAAVIGHPGLWPLIPLHLALVGGPLDLLVAPDLRDRSTGPIEFVSEWRRDPAASPLAPPRRPTRTEVRSRA